MRHASHGLGQDCVTFYFNAAQVEMVIVSDDCALPGKGIVGRRGIAGTVFVHKVRAYHSHRTLQLHVAPVLPLRPALLLLVVCLPTD